MRVVPAGGYDRAPYPDRGYPERGYPGEYDRGGYDRGYPPAGGYGYAHVATHHPHACIHAPGSCMAALWMCSAFAAGPAPKWGRGSCKWDRTCSVTQQLLMWAGAVAAMTGRPIPTATLPRTRTPGAPPAWPFLLGSIPACLRRVWPACPKHSCAGSNRNPQPCHLLGSRHIHVHMECCAS